MESPEHPQAQRRGWLYAVQRAGARRHPSGGSLDGRREPALAAHVGGATASDYMRAGLARSGTPLTYENSYQLDGRAKYDMKDEKGDLSDYKLVLVHLVV